MLVLMAGGSSLLAAQLFVTTQASDAVAVINPSTNQVVAQIHVGRYPERLVIAPHRRKAYVSNGGDGTLSVIDTANRVVTSTIPDAASPQESAVTPDESRVFVVHRTSGYVTVVDTRTLILSLLTWPLAATGPEMCLSAPTGSSLTWGMAPPTR